MFLLFAGYVPASITHFISFELGNLIETLCRLRLIANFRRWAFIAMFGMKTVIYVAVEIGGAMKPRASANEDTPGKPFRAVVAVGGAGVGFKSVVAISANRGPVFVWGIGHANTDADADTNLGVCGLEAERDQEKGAKCETS